MNLKEYELLKEDYSDLRRFADDQDKYIIVVEDERDRARREATIWKVVAALAAAGALIIATLTP